MVCWKIVFVQVFVCKLFRFLLYMIIAKASPVSIPARPIPTNIRPMRSSVEGLNQEIEKLVLHQDQPHTCRPETNLVNFILISFSFMIYKDKFHSLIVFER